MLHLLPTVLDLDGNPVSTKTVSVNQPLRFGGVTAYQTDWSMSGLQLQVEGSAGLPEGVTFQLPMASLQGEQRGRLGRGGKEEGGRSERWRSWQERGWLVW